MKNLFEKCTVVKLPVHKKQGGQEKVHAPWTALGAKPHELYILDTLERLKVGDYIHTSNIMIERVKAIEKDYGKEKGYEWLITVEGNGNQYKPVEIFGRIIATSDRSLGLPRPSLAFMKKYIQKGGIKEVMVEFVLETTGFDTHVGACEECKTMQECSMFGCHVHGDVFPNYVPKTVDNTITIKSVKNVWTDIHVVEHEELLRRFLTTSRPSTIEGLIEWLRDNHYVVVRK